jgi:hypothetical protein
VIVTCMCCSMARSGKTPCHSHPPHGPCPIHDLAPVVPLPGGGEDCTGPTVKSAVLAAYRTRGGVALELALKLYETS